MNDRQAYAFTHPLAEAYIDQPEHLAPYTVDAASPTDRGLILRSILAVDR